MHLTLKSLRRAFHGLKHTFILHKNFRTHILISFFTLVCGLIFGLTVTEWLIVFALITGGLIIELLNTSIESVVDLLTQEYRLHAMYAKDAAAAAMLLYALLAVVGGLVIFLPKLWQYF